MPVGLQYLLDDRAFHQVFVEDETFIDVRPPFPIISRALFSARVDKHISHSNICGALNHPPR